jgi:PAS domain S-box-containing protein
MGLDSLAAPLLALVLVLAGALTLAIRRWLRWKRAAAAARRSEELAARLQAAIRGAAEEWRLTFDAVASVLLVADAQGRVRRLNRAASELAGEPYHALLGRQVESLGAGEPWETAAALVAGVGASRLARSSSAADPSTGRTWDLSASLAAGADHDGDRVIVVARDITGIVRLQESLRRSEVMSAMGSLVAGVAHEVRNPLFGISAALDAFESRFGERGEHRRYFDVLKDQLARLNHLMVQLLEYGKGSQPATGPADLAAVVAEAAANCASLAARAGVAVETALDPGLPPLALDEAGMLQVFQNLLENSIQHSPPGCTVEVRAAVEGGEGRRWVACRVRDSGPGFRPDDLPLVFEPFFSRRRQGTGLGLSIVRRIVEQHGGQVAAANRPEGGAEMELRLPLIPAAADAGAAPARAEAPGRGRPAPTSGVGR